MLLKTGKCLFLIPRWSTRRTAATTTCRSPTCPPAECRRCSWAKCAARASPPGRPGSSASMEGVSRANVNFKSDPATNGRGFKMAYKAVVK